MESNTDQNMTGGGATEVAGAVGANNQGDVTGQSVPATSFTTNVARQSAPATGGQSLASELEKELETTPAVGAGPEPESAPVKSKKKGGDGLIIAMVFVILLAAGGIGFGVWAMMDGNQQKEELNLQISTLKKQNSELMERISVLEEEKESHSILDEPEEEVKEEYYEMEGLGIKIKKSEDFPDMVVKKNNDSTLGTYTIKRESSIPDNSTAPDAVSWMKSSTCDSDELNLGYGAKMEIGGSCYLMGQIGPYGAEPEYPLTDFLKYVMDAENYLAI